MRLYSRFFMLVLFPIAWSMNAYAFTVSDIKIQGLKHVPSSQVFQALPIHKGEKYNEANGSEIINALYKTGSFENIWLGREGNKLIIHVQEHPLISVITVEGNNHLDSKHLLPVLSQYFHLQEGLAFDPNQLQLAAQAIQQIYGGQGYYAASVQTQTKRSPDNARIALHIMIDEGPIVKVGTIQFVGNHAFSDRQLRKQFSLRTSSLFTLANHKDRYSPDLLDQDLSNLHDFYLNHGYFEANITKKVELSPDKKQAIITVSISEGPVYHFVGYKVVGNVYGLGAEMKKGIRLKGGDTFSKQLVNDTATFLSNTLASHGYAHTMVTTPAKIDHKAHTVYVTFSVSPGNRMYVRRINFIGNTRTDDRVLRHALSQYEGSVYSKEKLERSKQQLSFLPAVASPSPADQPTYEEVPVPGHPDQVDINYHVKEAQTSVARLEGGYSSIGGFMYGVSLSDTNFMGSGKTVNVGLQNNQISHSYTFSYLNPYYGAFGLQRSISFYYTSQKAGSRKGFGVPYSLNGFGGKVMYAYPISGRSSINFGYGYEHTYIHDVNTSVAPPSVLEYLGIPHGSSSMASQTYNHLKGYLGWTYQGTDRPIFPTKGLFATSGIEVGVPISDGSHGYYILNTNMQYYLPLWHGFILNLSTDLDYGGGFGSGFPFYKNFFSGGIGSVPAFVPDSLGPKNAKFGDTAIGGNLKTVFGAHLILPPFISDKVRTAILFDVGNVFQIPRSQGDLTYVPLNGLCNVRPCTGSKQIIQDDPFALSNLRYSVGLGVQWLTPLGVPLDVSVAFPINKKPGDRTEVFQFALTLGF